MTLSAGLLFLNFCSFLPTVQELRPCGHNLGRARPKFYVEKSGHGTQPRPPGKSPLAGHYSVRKHHRPIAFSFVTTGGATLWLQATERLTAALC
jgi:hypothetical protein